MDPEERHSHGMLLYSQSRYINYFRVKGAKITKTDGGYYWHQLLMLPVIDGKRTFSFKLRITKTQHSNIMSMGNGAVLHSCLAVAPSAIL